MPARIVALVSILGLFSTGALATGAVNAAELRAGVAKVDITNTESGPVNDPLYVKALVISDGTVTVVIATVDAVAIAEIGSIKNDYLANVRTQLQKDLDIKPANVLVNASHCHGVVCADVEQRTVKAVKKAAQNLVPVKIGSGVGHEDRVMENRRLKLKNGREVDIRRAYSLPPDEDIAGVGPVDPEIGILRLDRTNGSTLAVVYNFACHPIQGAPSGGNTADMAGFASQAIEDGLGDGAVALFLQGCAGDINPISYKEVDAPRNADQLGSLLGISTLKAAKRIKMQETGELKLIHETLALPRADLAERIDLLEVEEMRLVHSLKATNLNLKTLIPLMVKYNLSADFPAYHAHRYLHDKLMGRDDWNKLDAENRKNIEQYLQNIYIMEELTRLQTNLALLKMHQAQNVAAGKRTVDVELASLRIGDFLLTTFPGELTVQIGLNIKKNAPQKPTFVAGYTNGYIYYAPTAEQLKNVGRAQEDSDCILAPDWQMLYEEKVAEILKKL
jgi:hypothetical protein